MLIDDKKCSCCPEKLGNNCEPDSETNEYGLPSLDDYKENKLLVSYFENVEQD